MLLGVPSGVRVEEVRRVLGRVRTRVHSGGLDAVRSVAQCVAQCLALDLLACLCRVDLCEAWRSA